MPRSKLPRYVTAIADRAGRVRYYVRFRKHYQRLPDDPNTAEFHARYAAIREGIEADPKIGRATVRPGTIAALIRDYKASPEFAKLSERSQVSYAQQLDRLACLGTFQASDIGRGQILKLRDRVASKGTRTADLFIHITRRLFAFGVDREFVAANPASRVARLNDEQSYAPWTVSEARTFETSRPPAALLTAYMLGRWAAMRRGDVVRLRREQYDGRRLSMRQRKTGTDLVIPCHSALRAYLDALKIDVGLLVPGPGGKPWNESAFSKAFRAHLDTCRLSHLHFHGLRHMHATELAEAGGTDQEIGAMTGHSSPDMIARYTKRARQQRLAESAIAKLEARPKRTRRNGGRT